MITTLTLALLLAQDPPPTAKTVEERVKELADKIEALDKKAAALTQENASLQAKLEEAKRLREAMAKQAGTAWVKRYGPAAELGEKQSSEIEELWYAWSTQDFVKPCDAAGWKAREEALRGKLTTDQVPKLTRKVHEDQERTSKAFVASLARLSKLPADKIPELEKIVLPRLTPEEGLLLPQAYPEKTPSWAQLAVILDTNRTELSKALSAEEIDALLKMVSAWKGNR